MPDADAQTVSSTPLSLAVVTPAAPTDVLDPGEESMAELSQPKDDAVPAKGTFGLVFAGKFQSIGRGNTR